MSQSTVINDIDYGPLSYLVGNWKGDKGTDIAPESDGTEENPYFETILFEAIGDVTNAEEQILAVLFYHQLVSRKSTQKVFHNQSGYWMWDPATETVMHSFTIPRAVGVVAGGKVTAKPKGGSAAFEVKAKLGDKDWGIVQSPFMRDKASTTAFIQKVSIDQNTLSYSQTTSLEIYGKSFEHTDQNTLTRV